jgi:LuxR family maltose regulon positive regulatory protein
VLDDADRLPAATIEESVTYLLYNAPPNLRLVIGSRGALPLAATDLQASGDLLTLGIDQLRLTVDDSIESLRARFGERITLDDCVRLHEFTEGWPLGLQMAASTIERAPQPRTAITELSGRHGDLERFFLESMLSRLPADLADFLVRCSMLESMTPDLCAAVTESPAASASLEQLMRETPIVSVGEGQGWIRLHSLAREFLDGRFGRLPAAEQRALHMRAATWYASCHMLREAARHAFAGGEEAQAIRYASECLRVMAREGRLAEAREWSARLPTEELERDITLRLTVAWLKALGEAPEDAFALVESIAGDASVGPIARFEAGLIGACAAVFCDRPALIADSLAGWDAPPPSATPIHHVSFANPLSLAQMYAGLTQQARARIEQAGRIASNEPSMHLPQAFSDVIVGLSYLWEGRPPKAEEVLQPALDATERDSGRRSPIAAMLAAALAAVAFERDQLARARALLANRLDIIDRLGLPDTVLLAYRTLGDLALAEGDERHALDVFDGLRLIGETRRMPRLVLLSLAEQARIHATRARPETASALVAQIEALAPDFERHELQPLLPYYRMKLTLARTYIALATYDSKGAERLLAEAEVLARQLNRGRDAIVIKALQAVALHRQHQREARATLVKARELAQLNGLERLVSDLHPMVDEILGAAPARSAAPALPAASAAPSVAISGGLLTAKETEVLRLLAGSLSNKLIARTMDISDETVKWHLKNLFSKLNAGTRKHAVDRARLLGLLV